jgi:hypothetical protein
MTGWRPLCPGLTILAILCCGCGPRADQPTDTGSRQVVQTYFDALLQKDWPAAHAVLHPDSQKRCSLAQFTELARSYHRQIGCETAQVFIRSCEERGPEATAHVNIVGRTTAQKRRRYEDGIILRQSQQQWRVVLPKNFGHKR